MAEFSSVGVGNAGLATGIIGTTLGVLNSGLLNGGLIGGMGGGSAASMAQTAMQLGDHYATKEDLRYAQELARKDSEIALLKSEQNTEVKIADAYARLKGDLLTMERNQTAWNTSQSVANAQMSAAVAANSNSIAALQGCCEKITKLVVPASAVCPHPMPEFNSWTAPT